MSAVDKTELCQTCPAHEGQSTRVDTMWGAGKFGVWILPIILTALAVQGFYNNNRISNSRELTLTEKTESVQRYQEIELTLNTFGINLKNLMEHQGIEYIAPEEIKGKNSSMF